MAKYNFSYSANFNSNLNQSQLHSEIFGDTNITSNIIGINKKGDSVEIEFDSSLTTNEQDELNNLVVSHNPSSIPTNVKTINTTIGTKKFKNSSYQNLDTIIFNGGTYAKIFCDSFMDEGGISYSIRIYDKTNENIIVEKTFNNTEQEVQNLGVVTNVSPNKAIWEIQGRKIGGGNKSINVNSIFIEYA